MHERASTVEPAPRHFDRRARSPEAPSSAGRRAAFARLGGLALAAASVGSAGWATAASRGAPSSSDDDALPRPVSWQALLRDSDADGRPIVALFSTPGCGYCRLVRRDHLRHLARDGTRNGAIVVELSLADRTPFEATPSGATSSGVAREADASAVALAASPAALAESLGIRFAPTVAFFGPDGELAERLVGYASADFYGAYLDERIATATAALQRTAG